MICKSSVFTFVTKKETFFPERITVGKFPPLCLIIFILVQSSFSLRPHDVG